MVYFTEIICSSRKYLSITEDETTREEDVLYLLSLSPKTGFYAPSRTRLDVQRDDLRQWSTKISDGTPVVHQDNGCGAWLLQSPLYFYRAKPTPSPSFGRHIISGASYLGGCSRIRGEFTYIPKYWEWLEDATSRSKEILARARILGAIYCSRYTYDRNPYIMRAFCEAWCPEFNVLETSSGSVSISLWDLHNLGRLSIYGDMYEETVPCLEELTGSFSSGRFLPRSCEYLFAAFYHLQSNKKIVHITSWIDFWFRGTMKYHRPPKRVVKKSTHPKSTHNPNASIATAYSWSSEEQAAFEEMGIKSPIRLPTYLSAFIACWLCVFVFPHIDGLIHPETFKVACLMATGKCFNLAVPVLASLYRGLNDISCSTVAGSAKVCLPAHYIYGWMAHYFRTHYPVPNKVDGPSMTKYSGEGGAHYYDERTARKHIHDGESIYWPANLFRKEGDFRATDDSKLKEGDSSFLMSIRPCYLTLRRDDSFIAEPYSPSHFSRQFGFCQDIPYVPKGDKRSLSLEEGFRLWCLSTQSDTGSQLYVPATPTKLCNYLTERYRQWWRTRHDDYLTRGIETLIAKAHPPRRKGDDTCDKPVQVKPFRLAMKKRLVPPSERVKYGFG